VEVIVLAVLLIAALIAGLILWERSTRVPTRRNDHPRFQGRGISTARGAGAGRGAGAPARQTGPRFSPASTATPRFSGEVRRSPDAIGLACGRPIAECDRGADCLCVD
jgi:hypothetical protein